MDREISIRHKVDLERMLLDRSTKPTCLALPLLEDITNCFSEDQQIGSGGFAVVYKGIVGKGIVAVKKLSRTLDMHEIKFHKEVQCLMKAKHKNIVHFLGYCCEVHGRTADYDGKFVMADIRNWLLCFEYVPNRTLDKYITDASRGLEWRERYEIIRGICEGLLHLHEKHILHLDLKPSNILVDDCMVPKIADFGLSRCLDEEQTRAFTSNLCGSQGYLAPEFFRGEVTFPSDIYSLGVIIVEILTGEKGYPEDANVVDNWMNRLEGSDQWDVQLEQVKVCIKIGIECMDLDPKKRPVAHHIIDRLDETTNIDKTGISSSSAKQQVGLLNEQYCQEKIVNLSSEYLGKDIKEHAETKEIMEYDRTPRVDHRQQEQEEAPDDQWSLWGEEDTKKNINPQDASISASNSGLRYKLKNLNICNYKARREARRKYKMNGGPTSERHIVVKLYTEKELNLKQYLVPSNIIIQDDLGEVYKGLFNHVPVTLRRVVGVALPENRQFTDAVVIQCGAIHKNIVRLIGCCIEFDDPILVHEFLPKGNLQDILHSHNKVPLNLGARLSIVAASACGLAYIHSKANSGILHGDFKPANILSDENFVPKISNFGMSSISPRDMEVDMVYMDPVYLQTGLLTQESDVYSFGVVVLEILTRKKTADSGSDNLVRNFLKNHKQGSRATMLFDKEIAATVDYFLLESLAQLAAECLNLDVFRRPRMLDAARRLDTLNRARKLTT